MKLFLDSANLDQIKEAAKWGIIAGITTNPVLIHREGTKDVERIIKSICENILSFPIFKNHIVQSP